MPEDRPPQASPHSTADSAPSDPPASTPSATVAAFLNAIDSGRDETTEAMIPSLGPEHERELMQIAASEGGDRRWWALRALAAAGGSQSAALLASALNDPDASLRAMAALGLGHLYPRAPEAVATHLPVLARLLHDGDGFVRQTAVDGLALCGEAALPTLASVLAESPHEGARSRAAASLRAMRSIKTAPLLFKYLNDPNPLVHTFVREALDDLGLLDNVLLMP